jgi:hypothetical protein
MSSCFLVGLIEQQKMYFATFLGWGPLTAPKHTNPTKCQQEMVRKNYWYGEPGAKGGVEFML